jgi:hypothetical protein
VCLKIQDVQWKAAKAVRIVISGVSFMNLLTSDHLGYCCSAVGLSCPFHKPKHHEGNLFEVSLCQQGKTAVTKVCFVYQLFNHNFI